MSASLACVHVAGPFRCLFLYSLWWNVDLLLGPEAWKLVAFKFAGANSWAGHHEHTGLSCEVIIRLILDSSSPCIEQHVYNAIEASGLQQQLIKLACIWVQATEMHDVA